MRVARVLGAGESFYHILDLHRDNFGVLRRSTPHAVSNPGLNCSTDGYAISVAEEGAPPLRSGKPTVGIEPTTCSLRVSCSTN